MTRYIAHLHFSWFYPQITLRSGSFVALELDTHTEQSRQNKQSTPRAGEVLHGYSDDVH